MQQQKMKKALRNKIASDDKNSFKEQSSLLELFLAELLIERTI